MKIKLLIFSLLFSVVSWGQTTVFSENIGVGAGTQTIAATTFQNSSPILFSGSGDTRVTTPSSGYAGVSGGKNVFITNTIGTDFIISGIDTSTYTSLALTFGEFKSAAATTNLLVAEVSTDGVTYTPLTYTRADGAVWALISPTGTIPSTSNLRIRFRNPAVTHQFRVDDIILKGTKIYTVTYNGNTNDGGTAPVDASSPYNSGSTVTVLGAGTLTKTSNTFNGWNTLANGLGTAYAAANTFTIAANTTLYAQWLPSACTPPADPSGSIMATQNCGSTDLSFSPTNGNWYWQTSAGGTSTSFPTTGTYNVTTSGTYFVRAYDGTSCWSTGTISQAITVLTPVAITTQPTAQVVTVPATATFTVAATGTGLSYQWEVSTNGGGSWSPVGTNSNSYTTPATTLAMNGNLYHVIVSGTAPCGAVTSNNVSLTVNAGLCVDEAFSAGIAAPSGWTFTNIGGTYVSAGNFGASAPALQMDNTGDIVETPAVTSATELSFWIKGQGTNAVSALLVEGFNGVSWVTVQNITSSIPLVATTKIYNSSTTPALPANLLKFRFTYTKGAGNLAFDDVKVLCGPVLPACTTPVTQATALNFSAVTATSFNGSYTAAAAPGANAYLVVYSTDPTLSAGDLPVNGTPYAAGNTLGDGKVAYVGAGTSFSVSGLTAETTYYVFVFDYNNGGACSLVYNTTSPLTGNITPSTYCVSSGNTTFNTSVTNVTLNTINNTTAKPFGYSNYTAISTNLQQGTNYSLSTSINTAGNFTVLAFAWIDFNHDGDFADAGEAFDLGSATNVASGLTTLSPLTITIPLTATVGPTKMRVMATNDGDTSPCLSGFDGEVEDYTVNIVVSCTPTHTVASFAPTSGPTATDVTITGTGFTAGSTVSFNGITATSVVFVNSTTLIATVPAGATTGNVAVTEGGCRLISGVFTQIKKTGTCTNGNSLNDLIISEVYDSNAGNSWYMELYNPTNSPIDLDAAGANYKLVRYGNIGTTNGIRTVDITGVIPAGGVYLADLGSDSSCALGFNFVAKANGINENDEIRLTKNNVTVDMVYCPNEVGYSIIRNAAAVGPTAVFNAADWTTNSNESCADLGTVPFGFTSNTPTVNTNPVDVVSCGLAANFAVTATAGSGALTYQWYYNNGATAGWTAVTTLAGLTITGETTNSLNLSGTLGSYGGYQFYCQVTEGGTCSIASDAAQLSVTSTIWNGTTWSNGAPTIGKMAIINGTYNSTTNGNIDACSLFVNAGITATITDSMYFNVQNSVTVAVGGTLDIQNNGSLVQISDTGLNVGNIVMHRTANVKLQDYVYWASPVANFAVTNVSPSTPTSLIWKWNPTVANSNGGEGNWQGASGNMTLGQGYILRAPNGFSNSSTTPFTANFTGVPNNGVITPAISRGTDLGAGSNGPNGIMRTTNDDNWNLLGNPYPSAIGINAFLAANSEIDGFVRLWTHGTLPNTGISNPFYGNFTSNYTGADYIAVNGAGATSGPGVLSVVGAGQGFFVLMNPGAATTSSVTFNNGMRNSGFSNSQFYKSGSAQHVETSLENHRIWIDLVAASGETTRALVAYVEGATAGRDRLFDAVTENKNIQNFYSLVGNDLMTIQGKGLPFNADDTVPMGIKVPTNGTYTIAIAAVDGLFKTTSQKIYIEDKLLNTFNDITAMPYQFTANQGVTNDRFVLRYMNPTLSTQDFSTIENGVAVYPSNNEIKIGSRVENIKDYVVYNVLGQVLATKNKVNANESSVTSIVKNNQALIVKVTLENGLVVTRKIIF